MKYKEKFYLDRHGWCFYTKGEVVGIRFRYDPIPGSGNTYWMGNYYRRMKTTQELRWNCAHKKYTRGKRRKSFLPNSWDDWPRRDWRNDNWKRYRKKQYK